MSARDRESVVYVALDKMGGILTNVVDARTHGDPRKFDYHTLLVRNALSRDTVFSERVAETGATRVTHALPIENLHSVLRRMRRALPPGDGVLVATDWVELALASRYDTGRAVFQVLAGDYDYYYDIAVTHEPVVDTFIAVSRSIGERLSSLLPHRAASIHTIPYGVSVSELERSAASGPLRLVYAGRLDEAKGVLDLPEMDARLRALGVTVAWTVVGDGPDATKLRELVGDADRFRLAGLLSRRESVAQMSRSDVFVLPSRGEGLPVAMLEAMSVGVVPIVSDLPGGMSDVVVPGVTGFRASVGDVAAFASAVAELDRDRDLLERMSRACRGLIRQDYDLSRQVAEYESLFARWRELRQAWTGPRELPYASRLDRTWIPNSVVRLLRSRRRPELRPFLRSAKLGVESIATA